MSENYSVIVTYSFDETVPVYLRKTFEEAKTLLKELYEEEVRIDREEGNANECHINEDGTEATITNFRRSGDTDVTTWRIGEVFDQEPSANQDSESQTPNAPSLDNFAEQLENAIARMGYAVLGQDAEDVGIALIVRDKERDQNFRVVIDTEAC